MEQSVTLVNEPQSLKNHRKGGAASLVLAALMLEASRMVDDGNEIPHIEAVAKTTFGSDKGFLAKMDEIGIGRLCTYLDRMGDGSDAEDPIYQKYFNFFVPGESLRKKCGRHREGGVAPLWKARAGEDRGPEDAVLADLLTKRFQAVAFITAVEAVEEGLLEIEDLEKHCREAFGWDEGPFAMMNRLGIGEALRTVTEKMEMSHRREINFPIPRMLIDQARKNEPWPLNSKIR